MEKSVVEENKVLAKVTAKTIETGYLDFSWPFETLKRISDSEEILFWWIVKPSGEVFLADDPQMQGTIIDDSFLASKKLQARDSIYRGRGIKLIAHPLVIEVAKKPWTLYLGASLEPVEVAKRKIIFSGIGLFILISILIAPIAFYFSRGVTNPLERLRRSATIIGKGNLQHRIKIKTGDEIEELAGAFNKMAKGLGQSRAALEESRAGLEIKVSARTKELRELNETLEDKVKERTKELRERVNELEKFHRLTLGRELKMIDLKKKIRELEKKGRKKST